MSLLSGHVIHALAVLKLSSLRALCLCIRSSLLATMPVRQLSDAEKTAALAAASSELKWLASENEVGVVVQAAIYNAGFHSVKMFMGLGDSRAEVKETLRTQLGINPADSMEERRQVAAVQAMWDSANLYVSRETSAKAEARAHNLPRAVCFTEHKAMRVAVESQFGKLPRNLTPSKAYIGLKGEDIEDNEIRVEPLSEVSSREEAEVDLLLPAFDENGRIMIRKTPKSSKAPASTEELRDKLILMSNCWLFLKSKHSNLHWLSDFDDRVFDKYARHLLGSEVYGLRGAKEGPGGTVIEVRPTWAMLLKYELELRKFAADEVADNNLTWKQALLAAIKDPQAKNLHLIIPMTLGPEPSNSSRAQPSRTDRLAIRDTSEPRKNRSEKNKKKKKAQKARKQQEDNRRGGGGGGGGDRKGADINYKKLKVRFGDKPICFKYNNKGEDCDGSCNMAHVCQFCLSPDHKKFQCTHNKKGRND